MANVLVVEDDEQVRVLAESIIQEAGHHTLSAASEEQALALLRSGETIDVLFTDLGLGTVLEAGLGVAQEATKLRDGIAVIYTTGQSVTDGMRALFVDGSRLLTKPYTSDDLVKTIEAQIR